LQRARASALARHYRDIEGLRIADIAERLGRSPASVRSYLHDPDGSKAKRLKDSYRGNCPRCGKPTRGTGPTSNETLCATCNGRSSASWNRQKIEQALRAWNAMYGSPATSADLSMSYARKRAPHDNGARLQRLQAGWNGRPWPSTSVIQHHYRTVRAANTIALANERAGGE
jgi:hypothetical protein